MGQLVRWESGWVSGVLCPMVSEDGTAVRPHDTGRVVLHDRLVYGVRSPWPGPSPQAAPLLERVPGGGRSPLFRLARHYKGPCKTHCDKVQPFHTVRQGVKSSNPGPAT